MNQLSLRRYEIRGVLGRGGTGTVYEAYDTQNRAVVALKTIDASAAENLYRLKHEFRALVDVQHKNLVRFGELYSEGGQWYFTMELVRGTTFVEYVRPRERAPDEPSLPGFAWNSTVLRLCAPESGVMPTAKDEEAIGGGPVLDEARLRSTLGQLVDAIAAIHEAGHVHRDIKPSNVLVTTDGRVVLLDFGLVMALAARKDADASSDRELIGTPAYMAPEQVDDVNVGPAADWYAVGVMIFVSLTGKLPFRGSIPQVLHEKITREAPSPRELAPDAPRDLVDLCAALLRSDPAQRPRVDEIATRLHLAPREPAAHAGGGADFGALFIGRSAEVGVLERAFADVRGGRGRIVVIEGEPGVGKSALVHKFLATVGGQPVILAGRCYEQESMPFKGVDTVVDALSEHLVARTNEEVTVLLEGGVRYLAALFPVLARVPVVHAAVTEGRVDNEAGLRDLAFGELERLVDALASRVPLVVFLDDLQWADTDSVALLERVLLRPRGAACLFIATIRAGMEQAAGLSKLLADCERIPLRGLDAAEARELWDAVWPASDGAGESAAERDGAMRETAGHPFFLMEMARAARAGHIGHHAHVRLQDVLWRRIQAREPLEQRFLEMLALAGAPTPYEVVAKAAGVDVGETLTRLAGLKAGQLVRVTRRDEDRLVEPYHDRVREAIEEHLAAEDGGPRKIVERHLALGRALRESTREEALPLRIFAILPHLDAARGLLATRVERLDLASLHLLASRTARLATSYERAQHYAREGLAIAGDEGWSDAYALTRDLVLQRMEAEYLGGRVEDARASFDVARAHLAKSEERVAFYASWIGLETARGNFAEAIAAGREILRDLRAPLPASVSTLHVLRQYAENRIARGGRSIDDLLRLETLAGPTRESTLKILMALAPPAFFSDTNMFTWIMLRIAGLSMKWGVCSVSAYGFAGYGTVLAGGFNNHADGAAFGRLALALNERFKNDALAAKLHLLNGLFILPWTVPFATAKEELRRAHDAALKHGDTAYESYAVTNLSVLTFCGGESPAALQDTGEWARELSARRQEVDMAGMNAAFARYAATLRGQTPDPLDLGLEGAPDAEFAASLSGKSTTLARFYYHFCRAELAYLFGENDRAHALLGEAKKGAQGIFALPTMVELCLLEALVAARRYDAAPVMARPGILFLLATHVRKLAVWAKSCPQNFAAHYRIARAEWLRVLGGKGRASAAFDEAIDAARTHGPAKREALALDLASAHARTSGDVARADQLHRDAVDAYARWGAIIKTAPCRARA